MDQDFPIPILINWFKTHKPQEKSRFSTRTLKVKQRTNQKTESPRILKEVSSFFKYFRKGWGMDTNNVKDSQKTFGPGHYSGISFFNWSQIFHWPWSLYSLVVFHSSKTPTDHSLPHNTQTSLESFYPKEVRPNFPSAPPLTFSCDVPLSW